MTASVRKILLVTGARSLCDARCTIVALSRVWVLDHLRLHLESYNPALDLVVAGDAVGPDRWALELARERKLTFARWRLDGVVEKRLSNGDVQRRRFAETAVHPLDRNAAMARWCGERSTLGDKVSTLAFFHSESKTHGTHQTVSQVWKYCLPVQEFTYTSCIVTGKHFVTGKLRD